MTNMCGTCKYWEHPRTDFTQVVRLHTPYLGDDEQYDRQQERAHEQSQFWDKAYGKCAKVEMGPVEDHPIPQAVVLDGSEYMAELFTLESFGCILWEEGSWADWRTEQDPIGMRPSTAILGTGDGA